MIYNLDNPKHLTILLKRYEREGLRDGLRDLKRWGRNAFRLVRQELRRGIAARYMSRGAYGNGYQKAFSGLLEFNTTRSPRITRRTSGKQGG